MFEIIDMVPEWSDNGTKMNQMGGLGDQTVVWSHLSFDARLYSVLIYLTRYEHQIRLITYSNQLHFYNLNFISIRCIIPQNVRYAITHYNLNFTISPLFATLITSFSIILTISPEIKCVLRLSDYSVLLKHVIQGHSPLHIGVKGLLNHV